jgi:hypothetical protein
VVFVVFLPPACGNVVSQELETWFAERHEGTLAVDQAWIGSLYGEQKIKSLSLRDPEDNEIFNARITAPSLDGFFFQESDTFGPIEIQIPSLTLVQNADGTSNLDRALAYREGLDASTPQLQVKTDSDSVQIGPLTYAANIATIDLRITIDRLSWTAATAEELLLRDLECDGQVHIEDDGLRLELTGRGVFAGGPTDGLVFDLDVDSVQRWDDPGVFLPWNLNLELDNAPVLALETLVGREGQFAGAFGEILERCSILLIGESPDLCRVESFELMSTGAHVSLVGNWRRADEVLTAGDTDSILIGFPVDSWWTREVVGTLLPLMDEVELESANGRADLYLEEFVVPMTGSLWMTSALCTIRADDASYQLPPVLADELLVERQGTRPAPFVIDMAGGLADFASFVVSTEKGNLEVRGELDLKTRAYDLQVKTADGKEYEIQGTRADPRLGGD